MVSSLKWVQGRKRYKLGKVVANPTFIMTKQIDGNRPLQILTYLKTYISGLVLMVDHGKKWWHFRFKCTCGPNANN